MLNLFIYQKDEESIQVLNFKHPNTDRVVHVKYIHDNMYPGGNHYDAIIHIQKPQNKLQLLSKVVSRISPINTSQCKTQHDNLIDLTLSNDIMATKPFFIHILACRCTCIRGTQIWDWVCGCCTAYGSYLTFSYYLI